MPKAKYIEPTTKRTYTPERLQELRHAADLAGDTVSRDALGAKIREMGGTVPTGEIPENETKVGRLRRLRQDALDVNDIATAAKLAELIADEPQLTEGDPEPEKTTGKASLVGYERQGSEFPASEIPYTRTVDAPTEPLDVPESDLDTQEGPIASDTINNGKASVNATALIAKMGYTLSDIPARFGGKLDLHDVKAYRKILESE